jgi:serine/threonine protein kinase
MRFTGGDRASYLDRLCRGDEELRQEVEDLLAQNDRSGAFLGMLSSGGVQMVSGYRILERIGEGGMGLVYKAQDTRLKRLVAMKALPPWAAGDPAARERLLEEARCASSLNHPNIVTLYEILQETRISS